ncbi:hypothetical protein ACELLULO517_00480 [Acidisoma cellulosilytica]|uniref:Uncharacterized protein n=2 Tax=Acidisoma cellulosilyticum TaxID=2802395 RepID=A0A963YYP2_9PROT|nr:hypothetical protein [Acidisoma cellulosilyticum]
MDRKMTESQRAYEAKRAAKNGVSLDKWLQSKEQEKKAATEAKLPPAPAKPPGFFSRLMDRAHKPIKSKI